MSMKFSLDLENDLKSLSQVALCYFELKLKLNVCIIKELIK